MQNTYIQGYKSHCPALSLDLPTRSRKKAVFLMILTIQINTCCGYVTMGKALLFGSQIPRLYQEGVGLGDLPGPEQARPPWSLRVKQTPKCPHPARIFQGLLF